MATSTATGTGTGTGTPVVPVAPPHRARVRSPWTLVGLLALFAALVGICVPLAPVRTDDPVVSWPRAGALPEDTLVPLVPYRPRAVTIDVPCAAMQALEARGGGELLRTRDAAGTPTPGLVIAVAPGRVRMTSGDVTLLEGPAGGGACDLRLQADDSGVVVSKGGRTVFGDPDLLPPQIEKLQTDLTGTPEARGLQVTIRPDARFNSSPSTLKLALLALEVVLLVALLTTAWRRWPGRPPLRRRTGRPRARPHPADYAVVVISAAWLFLGPMNLDDGWYLEMALAGKQTGYIGNTVGQYSVGENPFVLHQYLMQLWSSDLHVGQTWSLIWMRLLVGLLGLATYALLRRALRMLLGPAAQRAALARSPWLLALAHLAWWLPYGLTLRPEPLIVLGSAATLVLAETARRRLSLGVLALAVAVAALTTTVSPSGLVAWAPVLVQVRWVGRSFVAASARERVSAALVLLAVPTIAFPIAFADASLGSVLASHTAQRAFYPDLRWYDEILHVAALFEPGDIASWGRRLPVLLTFACVGLALAGTRGARTPHGSVTRRESRPTVEQALLRVSMMVGIGVAILALSPTKWVNHYGALAGLGTPALALVMLRFPFFGGRWSTTARLGGTLLVALGLAASFAGPNMWRPITDWGQPFGERPIPFLDRTAIRPYTPHLGPFYGSTLVLWLLLAAVVFAVVWRRRGSRRLAGTVTGSALLTTGLALGVVLMGVVFVVAPVRQSPAWSAASSNWRAAIGTDCGLADAVQVDLDGPRPGTGAAHFVGVREALAGQETFVDVKVRPVWPCEGSTTTADGLTQLPRYRILAGEGLAGDTDLIYRTAARGGVQSVLDREARIVELPTLQVPTGPGQTDFGVIQRVDYTLPTADYDLLPGHRQVAGWEVGHPLVPPEVDRRSEASMSAAERAAKDREEDRS